MVLFKKIIERDFVIINFFLESVISSEILTILKPPDPVKEKFASKGVILSGEGTSLVIRISGSLLPPDKICCDL